MKLFITGLIIILVNDSIFSQNCYNPENVYSFEYNGIRYEIIKENKTWEEAAICAYTSGGKLVEINSQDEQDTIFAHLAKAEIDPAANIAPDGGDASYIWLGGTDKFEEGKWIWDGANTGFGAQFWEGLRLGDPVNGLYNNWGNEPDNFSDQDGLGLAITNWPLGTAGQWNDIQLSNELYFIVEYDNSTIRINKLDYDYSSGSLFVYSDFLRSYDLVHVTINDSIVANYPDISKIDTIFSIKYPVSVSKKVSVRLIAYSEFINPISQISSLYIFSKNNPLDSYYTDFENIPSEDFLGNGFEIKREFGFRDYAIHSRHNYENDDEYTFTLIRPIIIDQNNSEMQYSDVAIVEPGIEGSVFGDAAFNDYVIVEGSSNLVDWLPLIEGYDSRKDAQWETAWLEGGVFRNMYKTQSLNLADNFNSGDTILIRFKIHSNASVTGWGWTIDNLIIQGNLLNYHSPLLTGNSLRLFQNYPNPFNPSTTISFEIPVKGFVKLAVFDILGKEIETVVQKELPPGVYTYKFDASGYSSGTYIYRITVGEYSLANKFTIIK